MSTALLERVPRHEAPSELPIDVPGGLPSPHDRPTELNRPVRFTASPIRSAVAPSPTPSICILLAPRPATALVVFDTVMRWLDLVRGPGGLVVLGLGGLGLVLGLAGLFWAGTEGNPAERSGEQPAVQASARPADRVPGPGFIAFTGTAAEPIRFIVNRSWNQTAAVPGALLFDWQADRPQPAIRLSVGNSLVEPEVDRPTPSGSGAETIRYREAWPGVDVVIRTTSTGVAYDLIVQPGADPTVVELTYPDAITLSIEPDGRLRSQGSAGGWIDGLPESWQDGSAGRDSVPTHFELRGGSRFGFVVGPYDPARPVVIDPPMEPAE